MIMSADRLCSLINNRLIIWNFSAFSQIESQYGKELSGLNLLINLVILERLLQNHQNDYH